MSKELINQLELLEKQLIEINKLTDKHIDFNGKLRIFYQELKGFKKQLKIKENI